MVSYLNLTQTILTQHPNSLTSNCVSELSWSWVKFSHFNILIYYNVNQTYYLAFSYKLNHFARKYWVKGVLLKSSEFSHFTIFTYNVNQTHCLVFSCKLNILQLLDIIKHDLNFWEYQIYIFSYHYAGRRTHT